jgi:hypothetical protein
MQKQHFFAVNTLSMLRTANRGTGLNNKIEEGRRGRIHGWIFHHPAPLGCKALVIHSFAMVAPLVFFACNKNILTKSVAQIKGKAKILSKLLELIGFKDNTKS